MASKTKTKKKKSKPTSSLAPKRDPPTWTILCNLSKPVSQDEFEEWASYLAKRKRPDPAKLFPDSVTQPLTWGLPTDVLANTELLEFLRGIGKLKTKASSNGKTKNDDALIDRLGPWLASRGANASSATDGLECLAWAYVAPRLAKRIPADRWRELISQLLKTVEEAEFGREHANGWSQLLVSGELPLALAYQLSELPDCRRLAKPAARFVSQCIEQWLDGRGLLHANNLASIRPLLATLTRSIRIGQEIEGAKIRKSAMAEFEWFVQQALRLTRCNLSSAMTPIDNATSKKAFKDLFQSALSLTKDKQDAFLLDSVLHAHSPKSAKSPDDDDLPDNPSYQSDWSDCAILQPQWSPQEPRLVVTHSEKEMRGEFTIGKDIVFAGDLMPSISIDGKIVTIKDDWECVCWFADDDVDMLEVRTNLSNGWKLERQFLMARDDQFAVIADVLTSPSTEAEIIYRNTLPLCDGIRFEPNSETNEGYLCGKSKLGLVLPLALPEWRSEPCNGSLESSDEGLSLQIASSSTTLYAPLFIDFHRRRMRTTPTWRRLTVADQLRTVGSSEAVGYRIHVGIEQWLIYRSLQPTVSRTVLGQHLSDEFVCGRFLNDGTIESLVEIAAGDPKSSE